MVGDSVAMNVDMGLHAWSERSRTAQIWSATKLGCPIARGGDFRAKQDVSPFPPYCDWATFLPGFLRSQQPDVVVVMSGVWDVVDRRFPGDDRWRHIGQPEVDNFILSEYLSVIDLLGSSGASVALLTYPHFKLGISQGFTDLPEWDPARIDRLNALLREAAAARPGVARIVDFQAWYASLPGGEMDLSRRPDGLHFTDAFLPTIGTWLGPQLVEIARNP